MSKDDFDVVVCKLLSYLMACIKAGVRPSAGKAKELTGCNDVYWEAAIEDLSEAGYIKIDGASSFSERYACIFDIRITMSGRST